MKQMIGTAILLIASTNGMAGDLNQGKSKAVICAGCHGLDGFGLSQEYPNLANQKSAYLIKQLKAFKQGTRTNATMQAITASLSTVDIDNVATYYESLSNKKSVQRMDNLFKPSYPSTTEFPEPIFISLKKAAKITQFPSEQVWQGGENMLFNAITPNGKILLSTSPSTNTVYIFNAKTGKTLAIVSVGKAPKGVKVTPDGQFAYISNQGSNNISVVELTQFKVVNTIQTEKDPHNVRFSTDGKQGYVTLQGGAGIGVLDIKQQKMVRVIPTPGITGPHNLDLSANGKIAFVRDFVHHVAVVDLVQGKVIKVIKVGNGHGGIDVAPNNQFVATAAIGDDFISIIDSHTFAVQNIKVGRGPHGIRASKDSHWLYVSVAKDNRVVVINMQTKKVEKSIEVGAFPFWISVQGNP